MAKTTTKTKADLNKGPRGRISDAIRTLKARPRVIHSGDELFLGINHVKRIGGGNPKKRSPEMRKLIREYKDEAYKALEAKQHRLHGQSKV